MCIGVPAKRGNSEHNGHSHINRRTTVCVLGFCTVSSIHPSLVCICLSGCGVRQQESDKGPRLANGAGQCGLILIPSPPHRARPGAAGRGGLTERAALLGNTLCPARPCAGCQCWLVGQVALRKVRYGTQSSGAPGAAATTAARTTTQMIPIDIIEFRKDLSG